MARSVSDLILLDSVISRDWRNTPTIAPRRIRLGVVPEMFENIDAETLALVNQALDKLRNAGVQVVPLQTSGFLISTISPDSRSRYSKRRATSRHI